MTAPLELVTESRVPRSRGTRTVVPKCAACGRPLRKSRYVAFIGGDNRVAYVDERYDKKTADKLRREGEALSVDGGVSRRGDYGDGIVCTMRCGWLLAVRLVMAAPDVLEVLPKEWRTR